MAGSLLGVEATRTLLLQTLPFLELLLVLGESSRTTLLGPHRADLLLAEIGEDGLVH